MEFPVLGGFPRISVELQQLSIKQAQGFDDRNKHSLKNLLLSKPKNPMMLRNPNTVNVVQDFNGKMIGGKSIDTRKVSINGIPLSVITG